MGKLIGAALVGVVIGAAIAEIIDKQKPDLVRNLGKSVKNGWQAVREAFGEGYRETAMGAATVPAE